MDKLKFLIDRNTKQLDRILELIEGSSAPWLNSRETAVYLRCSPSKIEDLTNSGLLPFRRHVSRLARSPRLYHKKDLDRYLISGRNPAAKPLTASERRILKDLM